jgi:hypothetical protein
MAEGDEAFLRRAKEHLEQRSAELSANAMFTALREVDRDAYQALWYIAQEVVRQREDEGWTVAHDDEHGNGEMASAAACYALLVAQPPNDHRHGLGYPPSAWPWDVKWWKPKNTNRNLIRAGALIVAEWGRFMRASVARSSS